MTSLCEDRTVNLQISHSLPLNDQTDQAGGNFSANVADILTKVKNKHYGYLTSVEPDITNRNLIPNNKYIFEYTTENDKCATDDLTKIMCAEFFENSEKFANKQIISNFFGSGTYSAVFSIKKIKNDDTSNKPLKKRHFENVISCIPDENIIIKMFRPHDLDIFINTWKNDKIKYGDHMIDIYLYGSIIDELGQEISKYIITKKYNIITDNTINGLSLSNRLNIIISMLDFCNQLQSEEKVWSDLKSENIGYTIKDDQFIAVVIDYDEFAIIDKIKFNALCEKYGSKSYMFISKTYAPAYADIFINNPYIWTENNYNFLSTFITKLSIIGAVDIINTLLLEGFDGKFGKNLSTLIYYFNFNRFNDKINNTKLIINFAIFEVYNKFVISHLQNAVTMFGEEYFKINLNILLIVTKMLEYNYNKIPLYGDISEKFKNILDEINQTIDSTIVATTTTTTTAPTTPITTNHDIRNSRTISASGLSGLNQPLQSGGTYYKKFLKYKKKIENII